MPHKLLEYPEALCNQLNRIIVEAGEITLDHFDDAGCEFHQEGEDSPLTLARNEAEQYIYTALTKLLTDVPIIGMTTPRLEDSSYFWLVSPLDDPQEFISGNGEYTISIALIHEHKPWIGVVYAPYLGELYGGCVDHGAYKWNEETGTQKSIQVRQPPSSGIIAVTSRSNQNTPPRDDFLQDFKVKKLVKKGGALKICTIAAGKADLYPCFAPTSEWEIAAAHAVLESAGGYLVETNNYAPLNYAYNRDQKWLNLEFIATGFSFFE